MKYAVFDEKGLPKGFYDPTIHKNIPKNAVEISEDIWKRLLTGKYAYINGELVEITGKVWDNKKKIWREKSKDELLREYKETHQKELKELEKQTVLKVLDSYGYIDLADVRYWNNQDPQDPEPKALLEWYKAYDDAIWEEIDSLQNKTFEELKDYDLQKVEAQIFEKTKSLLPKEED